MPDNAPRASQDALRAAERALRAAQDKKKRRQMGKPLDLTDDDLTSLAAVGIEALPEAEAYVRQLAGEDGIDLLEADTEEAPL